MHAERHMGGSAEINVFVKIVFRLWKPSKKKGLSWMFYAMWTALSTFNCFLFNIISMWKKCQSVLFNHALAQSGHLLYKVCNMGRAINKENIS